MAVEDIYDPASQGDLSYDPSSIGLYDDPYASAGYPDPQDLLGAAEDSQMDPEQVKTALDSSRQRIAELDKAYGKTLEESTGLYQRQQAILDAARDRILKGGSGPTRAETLLALAASMGQPTKTGSFGETLSNVAGAGSGILTAKRKDADENAALADKYGLESGNVALKQLDARQRQYLTSMEAERSRNVRLQVNTQGHAARIPFGVTMVNGRPYWADENGVMKAHTIDEYYSMVAAQKASGAVPFKAMNGPFGPVPLSQVLGTPGATDSGGGSTQPQGSAPPPARPPIVSHEAATSNPVTPEEIQSIESVFTPFAGLPQEGSLITDKTAPILKESIARGLREVPRFPQAGPVSGPGALQLREAITADSKMGVTMTNDLRVKASASDDVLKNYSHMFDDLAGGMRTGKIGMAATAIEEALAGVLPESVVSSFIDMERKSREQNFDKWALDSATRTLKMIYGGRIAVFEVQTAINSSPGRNISEKASYAIMKAKADWAQEQILKQQVWEEYRSRGGTVLGFEGWYRSHVSPYYDNYVRQVIKGGGKPPAGAAPGTTPPVSREEALRQELLRRQGGG